MKRFLLVLAIVAGYSGVNAQPGTLDPDFGTQGFLRTNFRPNGNSNNNTCHKVLSAADGSFYLVFEFNSQTFVTHRFANGALDITYGDGGYSVPVGIVTAHAVLQPDGKVVIGGSASGSNYADFALARLNTNGTLDNSFSGDGIETLDFASSDDNMNAIALQPDGKIVTAGLTYKNGEGDFALARFNTNGSPDNSFSGDGKQTSDFTRPYEVAYAVAVHSSGKIVAAGLSSGFSGGDAAVACYTPGGNPDLLFSGDGKLLIAAGSTTIATAVAFQSDGKIVVGGNTRTNLISDYNFMIVRLHSTGAYDYSFSDGVRITDITTNSPDGLEALLIQGDGRIVAGGRTGNSNTDFVVVRYTIYGAIDGTFGGYGVPAGRTITPIGPGEDLLTSLAIRPDGKLLAAGSATFATGVSNYAVARYNLNGTLDTSFDKDGILMDYKPSNLTDYYGSAVQPDGKIITVGVSRTGTNSDFAIARYNVNGTLDNTFSNDGMTIIDFGGADVAASVVVQPNGKIVVAGTGSAGGAADYAVARLNSDGSLDNSFGGTGKVLTDFSGFADNANTVVLQQDGKIVVSGHSIFGNGPGKIGFAIARYNIDGSLDNTFSGDGKVVKTISPNDYCTGMVIQPDGKLVLSGVSYIGNPYGITDFILMRFNPDGSPDASFNGNGYVVTDLHGPIDEAYCVALQADGKIVVGGVSGDFVAGANLAIARYNTKGTLDNTFSGDGIHKIDLGSDWEQLYAITVQSNGKIIAGGFTRKNNQFDVALVRLNSNGTMDNTFSDDGIVTDDFGQGDDLVRSLTIRGNRVYAVGLSENGNRMGMVAAYLVENRLIPIVCPGQKDVVTEPGKCSAIVNGIDPVNMPPGATLSYQLYGATTGAGSGSASGLTFNHGATSVVYRYDTGSSCGFQVLVHDMESPKASYPAVTKLCYNPTNYYTLPLLQATDNCGVTSQSYQITGPIARGGETIDPSGYLLPGEYNIEWTARDGTTTSPATGTIIVSGPLSVTIPDVKALNTGVVPNTVYTGYEPASRLTLTALVPAQGGPCTYLWSTGATTASIIVSPLQATTYTVTVTNANGCSQTSSKFINVIDVRCGNKLNKVQVCHVPKGNPANAHALCISSDEVAEHLAHGDYLGACKTELITGKDRGNEVIEDVTGTVISAYPNPSAYFFNVRFKGPENEKAELVVWDAAGRVIEKRTVVPNATFQLGERYKPGIYIVQIRQGATVSRLKLVRMSE